MPNGTSHEPQFSKRVLFFAAGGGFAGSMLAILLMYWLCGCPCGDVRAQPAPAPTSSVPAAAN